MDFGRRTNDPSFPQCSEQQRVLCSLRNQSMTIPIIFYGFILFWMIKSLGVLIERVHNAMLYIYYPEMFKLIDSVTIQKIHAAQIDAWFFETYF